MVVLARGVLNDGDTYWHIATGRWIFEHRQVPTHDPFSYTMPGAPWTAHEWGTELLMASLYRLWGWSGLVLLLATTFALTIGYVTRFSLARIEPLYALMFTGLSLLMTLPSLLVRPHALVWPVTVLWVGTLLSASEARRAPPWWLLGVLVLWANLHASFVFGLALAGALGADAVISASPGARWQVGRMWLRFLVAAGACALINPEGFRTILYALQVMHMQSALAVIGEWQSPNFQKPEVLTVWLLVVLGLAFAGRARLPLVRAILVMGLLLLALEHQRNVALLGLISVLVTVQPFGLHWREQRTPSAEVEILDRWFAAFAAPARWATSSAMCLLVCALAVVVMHARPPEPSQQMTPRRALDALTATGARSRILHSYHFGGYLIFRGIPVFIDGRGDMYGDSFVDNFFKATTLTGGSPVLEGVLQRYQIDSTLLTPDTPATQLLDHLPGWRRVYTDAVAVVHVRTR